MDLVYAEGVCPTGEYPLQGQGWLAYVHIPDAE